MPINKIITSRTIGENDGISQVFIQNNIPKILEPLVEPKIFNLPLYNLDGATFKYYQQVVDGISVNVNNEKTLTYEYTANTTSFSSVTNVLYDIYRVDFPTYDTVSSNLDDGGDQINPTTGSTGFTPTKETISSLLTTPLATIYETGDTISTPTHILSLPEIIKPIGGFAEQLLLDKAQYFIDTRYEFIQERDKTLGGFKVFSGGSVVDFSYSGLNSDGNFLITTQRDETIISGGTYSGLTTNGAIFTYFSAPQKPNIDVIDDAPTVIGQLDTFSPIFSFNNVSDGDYYKLQVTYDLADTTFLSAFTFNIAQQPGIADFIRTHSVTLSPDSAFLYRFGNTKEVINVFGVKQSVTNWGRNESAITDTDGIYTVQGTVYQDYNYGCPVSGATVVFTVSLTTATLEVGVDTTTDISIAAGTNEPIGGGAGTSFSGLTDSNGNYSVTNVAGGSGIVTVSKFGYDDTPQAYFIDEDTIGLDLTINLLWGSTGTTFADVGDCIFV